ncbi:MFS transporter [Rossellomorea marisflavi]|uniref:MFS transporter n=2 Tax=Rossellomorea marisflavi TaxID=189381 RepID=A0A5D4RZX2_9BACI|nr:MFS transporter [Rossellomorea marisflavi]
MNMANSKTRSRNQSILYLMSLVAFFASLNQNIYTPLIPSIKEYFHINGLAVNSTVSLFIILTAIIQLIMAPYLDRTKTGHILVGSLVLVALASLGCALSQGFYAFLFFRCLQAIGAASLPLIAVITIMGETPEVKQGEAMGTYQMFLSIAPAAAPVLGGIIGARYEFHGVFWFLAGLSLLFLFLNVRRRNTTVKKEKLHQSLRYLDLMRDPVVFVILSLSLVVFLVYMAILVFLPELLADRFHIGLKWIGFLYVPVTGSIVAGSYLFKKVKLNFSHVIGAVSVSLILFALMDQWLLPLTLFLLILFGMGLGAATPLFATLLTSRYKEGKGSIMALYNVTRYIGMGAGPVVFSLFYREMGEKGTFLILSALLLALSFSFYSVISSSKKKYPI